jgi:hypothetical protein
MKQFEYISTRSGSGDQIHREDKLTALGLEGWEIVGVSDGRYIMKREIPQSPEPIQGRHERTQDGYDGYER